MVCACEDLERNNPLDPRNPRSERSRVTFIEAFINDATPFSPFALTALDSLALAFAFDEIIIAEHHLPSASFNDAYALQESADRYQSLAPADRGVPDVFLNGTTVRLQGASNSHMALRRYRSALQNELGKISHFTIAAKKSISATGIEVNATIARLGDVPFTQFAVVAMIAEDLGMAGHRQVVRKIFAPEVVSSIDAGETKSFRFAAGLTGVQNAARLQAVVLLEDRGNSSREVLQATLAE